MLIAAPRQEGRQFTKKNAVPGTAAGRLAPPLRRLGGNRIAAIDARRFRTILME